MSTIDPPPTTRLSPTVGAEHAHREYWETGTFRYGCLHDRLLCILDEMRQLSPASVFDVGCSGGQLAHAIAEHLPRAIYFGCDISRSAVDRLDSPRIVQCDLNTDDLPFAGQRFDCVVASGICEYIFDLPALLVGIHERIDDGGTLLLSYVNNHHVARMARRMLGRSAGGNRTWQPLMSLGQLERLLTQSGFQITRRSVSSGRIDDVARPTAWRAAYRRLLRRSRPLRRLLARQVVYVCRKRC